MQFDTQGIIHSLERQKAAIESAIAALNGSGKSKKRGPKKKRSKATRLRMSRAQRKRWKVLRGAGKKK